MRKKKTFKKINRVREARTEYKRRDAIERAKEYGIDVTLLYESLSLTPTERMERHEKFLKEIAELRRAGEKKYGKF